MHNREFKFGYQHFLLCQKSFLKVSSKWLLKNKSDNGKVLVGKTYSGERFRAILALLFSSAEHNVLKGSFKGGAVICRVLWVVNNFFKHLLLPKHWANLDQTGRECSLGGPLQNLLTEFDSIKNSGRHGNEIEFF